VEYAASQVTNAAAFLPLASSAMRKYEAAEKIYPERKRPEWD
jgi:hypothetical protein